MTRSVVDFTDNKSQQSKIEEKPKDLVRGPATKNIKSKVKIHDRTQLETIFTYSFDAGSTKADPCYSVDAYMFFPQQLGINPITYDRSKFYADMRALIRFREPKLSYVDLMGEVRDDDVFGSPVRLIESSIKALSNPGGPYSSAFAIDEVRLFGCSYVSYYWRRIKRKHLLLKRAKTPEDIEEAVLEAKRTLDKGRRLLKVCRELLGKALEVDSDKAKQLQNELTLVNEYCTYCYRDGLLKALVGLERHKNKPECQTMISKVNAQLRLERWYARKAGFFWVSDKSSKLLLEEYMYRRGSLKRRIWSVLYLNLRPDAFFKLQQQFGYMVAAGMAAGWALFATLLIWNYSSFRGFNVFEALSATSISLITLSFVLSYVLKDRIKELGRSKFERGIFKKRPDIASNIYFSDTYDHQVKLGILSETVSFLKRDQLPNDVQALRLAHTGFDVDLNEQSTEVLKYSKQTVLHRSAMKKLHYPVQSLDDIIRLNIESFLSRLDAPLHLGLVADHDHGGLEVMMPKVYYVDLILKYRLDQINKKERAVSHEYFRLVLDKRGLSRIEQIK